MKQLRRTHTLAPKLESNDETLPLTLPPNTSVPLCACWLKPDLLADEAPFFWLIVSSMLLPKLYGVAKILVFTD